jgi:chemotaxis protein CheD
MSNIHPIHGSPKRRINLLPGDHYVSDNDVIIGTLLGSCVSACLYDPVKRIVGMNHFMLSAKKHAGSMPLCLTEAGRYGVHAMELIINGMLRLGARKENFHAKVFGGSSLFSVHDDADDFNGVGETNCRFILEFLRDEGIRLVASNLGGNEGRVIRFHSKDFSVYQRRIKRTTAPNLVKREKHFWEREALKKQPEPELWG